jgi:hypothetical protein
MELFCLNWYCLAHEVQVNLLIIKWELLLSYDSMLSFICLAYFLS